LSSEELRIVDETLGETASISIVARWNGVALNLLYRWRRLMLEGGAVAVVPLTSKRDYVNVTPLPDATTVLGLIAGRCEHYNENHPHSGLKICTPREFIAAQTATA